MWNFLFNLPNGSACTSGYIFWVFLLFCFYQFSFSYLRTAFFPLRGISIAPLLCCRTFLSWTVKYLRVGVCTYFSNTKYEACLLRESYISSIAAMGTRYCKIRIQDVTVCTVWMELGFMSRFKKTCYYAQVALISKWNTVFELLTACTKPCKLILFLSALRCTVSNKCPRYELESKPICLAWCISSYWIFNIIKGKCLPANSEIIFQVISQNTAEN